MSMAHTSSRVLPLNSQQHFTTFINPFDNQPIISNTKPIQNAQPIQSSFLEQTKEQQGETTSQIIENSHSTIMGYDKVLKGKLMIEINKAIGKDGMNGKIVIEILKRIPSSLHYYQSIFNTLTSQQICMLLEDIEILIYLFQQLYYLIYRKLPAPSIIEYLKDRATLLDKGFQRLPFLSLYFPHQLTVSHTLFKHSHDTILRQISDVYFIDKLMSQCCSPEEQFDHSPSQSRCKQQHKQLLASLNKIVRTALYNSMNREQISAGIFTAKLILRVNKQLEKNNITNSTVIMELLANLSKYNPQLFWKQCYENQQFIETIIIEEIYKVYDAREQGCYDDNIYTFLEEMNNIKNARLMVSNCLYSLIDITIQTKVILLLNKLLVKNKILVIKVVPLALEKINKIIKGVRLSRVYLIALIEFFQILFRCKYPIIHSNIKNFIGLIQKSLKQKHSDLLYISFQKLKLEVKKRIDSGQSKQSKYLWSLNSLMIQ